MIICLEQGADLHMAQLMPLPLTVSCFSKIQTGFTFLVPAHPGCPGKRAVKRVCVIKQELTHQACMKARYNIFRKLFGSFRIFSPNTEFPDNSQPYMKHLIHRILRSHGIKNCELFTLISVTPSPSVADIIKTASKFGQPSRSLIARPISCKRA